MVWCFGGAGTAGDDEGSGFGDDELTGEKGGGDNGREEEEDDGEEGEGVMHFGWSELRDADWVVETLLLRSSLNGQN